MGEKGAGKQKKGRRQAGKNRGGEIGNFYKETYYKDILAELQKVMAPARSIYWHVYYASHAYKSCEQRREGSNNFQFIHKELMVAVLGLSSVKELSAALKELKEAGLIRLRSGNGNIKDVTRCHGPVTVIIPRRINEIRKYRSAIRDKAESNEEAAERKRLQRAREEIEKEIGKWPAHWYGGLKSRLKVSSIGELDSNQINKAWEIIGIYYHNEMDKFNTPQQKKKAAALVNKLIKKGMSQDVTGCHGVSTQTTTQPDKASKTNNPNSPPNPPSVGLPDGGVGPGIGGKGPPGDVCPGGPAPDTGGNSKPDTAPGGRFPGSKPRKPPPSVGPPSGKRQTQHGGQKSEKQIVDEIVRRLKPAVEDFRERTKSKATLKKLNQAFFNWVTGRNKGSMLNAMSRLEEGIRECDRVGIHFGKFLDGLGL